MIMNRVGVRHYVSIKPKSPSMEYVRANTIRTELKKFCTEQANKYIKLVDDKIGETFPHNLRYQRVYKLGHETIFKIKYDDIKRDFLKFKYNYKKIILFSYKKCKPNRKYLKDLDYYNLVDDNKIIQLIYSILLAKFNNRYNLLLTIERDNANDYNLSIAHKY